MVDRPVLDPDRPVVVFAVLRPTLPPVKLGSGPCPPLTETPIWGLADGMWQARLQHILDNRYAYIGAVVAAMLGLMAGLAMRPKLTPVEPPKPVAEAPGFDGPSQAAPASPMAFTAYHKGVPDYVLGTDWTASETPPPPPPPTDFSVFDTDPPEPSAPADPAPEPDQAQASATEVPNT